MPTYRRLAAIAVASLPVATAAHAVSIGDAVSCSGFDCGAFSSTIASGPEFEAVVTNQLPPPPPPTGSHMPTPIYDQFGYIYSDFGPNSLSLFAYPRAAFSADPANQYLYLSDVTRPITSYRLLSVTNIAGFDASNISLANGTLRFQLGDVTFSPQSRIDLTLGSAAPEPAGWALLITGFGGIGAAMRRRTRLGRAPAPAC